MSEYVFSERATKNHRAEVIDVHHKGKNVAYVRAHPKNRIGVVYIDSLYVSPDHRGKELSHELLSRVIDKYKTKELRLQVDPFRDKPLNVTKLKKLYSSHGFESTGRWQMVRKPLEKNAGGDIVGRLAGLASRPFIGPDRSAALQNKIIGGVTNYVNRPIENVLRRSGVHGAISKVYEHGTRPIPGTPRFVQPIMHDPAQRRAYGQWRADDLVHTFANNPEIVGALAVPAPGVAETYLAGKHLLGRALGGGVKKLAAFTRSFSDELEKIAGSIANGDQMQYFLDNPEKYEAWKKRQKGKIKTAQVSPYQQKTQWTCSAACLKAVLEHYGVRLPELVIIEAIGAKKGRGAECDEIAAAARKLGFSAFEYSFESLDQAKVLLDQDIPIICDIQSFNNPGKGHYVVMTSANDTVALMDPNTPNNQRTISREEMDERWWDRAMAPPNQLMPKWGIVVVPPEDPGDSP